MTRRFVLLIWAALAFSIPAREPAVVRLDCLSLRLGDASGGPGQAATLRLTSDWGLSEFNGELAPLFDPTAPSHGAYFVFEDPASVESIAGQIAVDTPPPVDENGDGFDDFFQASQAVMSTVTHGIFQMPIDQGTVTATWARAAGSATGTCKLQLVGQTYGQLPTFTHTFTLLEYVGTLAYVTSTNGVSGQLSLKQYQAPANSLAGLLSLTRSATNRFDQLRLQPGALTNATLQTLSFLAEDILRDTTVRTNYSGYFDFTDGDPGTGLADYLTWVLSIDDTNDSDGNSIPDFSDDPTPTGAGAAQLSIARTGGQLWLTLQGTPAQTYDLQQVTSLIETNWQKTASVTLTNSTAMVPLSASGPSTFWRAVSR